MDWWLWIVVVVVLAPPGFFLLSLVAEAWVKWGMLAGVAAALAIAAAVYFVLTSDSGGECVAEDRFGQCIAWEQAEP
jgi:high-affinity Fe2+/Pb2+ permease